MPLNRRSRNRLLAGGLALVGGAGGTVWAEASEQPALPPAKKEASAPPSDERASKPAKPPRRISGFTEEREAAAMTFVRANHPELALLLEQLKLSDNAEYQRAIRELFHSSEKLAQLQERNPRRYPMELATWKLNSRIQLLVARLSMSADPKIEDELRQALRQQLELRKASLNDDRERLETRLAELNEQLGQARPRSGAYVEQRMAKLLGEASRSRSELKAA